MLGRLLLGVTFVAVVCLTSSALADQPRAPESGGETPWSKGVTAEQKASAERLLGEGNDLFVQNRYREALAKYQEALAAWDHPAIRFNMVRTLIALDRPLEAADNLDKALAYGRAPLEEQVYIEALNYQHLLAAEIAELEISCTQPGVKVKLDGRNLLECPGAKLIRTLPGNHVVVGSREGFLATAEVVNVPPGRKTHIPIELVTIEKATVFRSRWSTWKPWALVGSGAAVLGVGLLVDNESRNDMAQLGRSAMAACPKDRGCNRDEYEAAGLAALEARARTENHFGVGLMIVGSAVVATGLVAVIYNRPRAFLPGPEHSATATRWQPLVLGDGAGLTVSGRF